MIWGAPLPDNLAPPAVLHALLTKALAAAPNNAKLHAKLGHLRYDRHDYPAAAASFAAAARLDPSEPDISRLLARCYNHLQRPQEALAAVADLDDGGLERGRALIELGQTEAAERELRAILRKNPDDPTACRLLCRLFRREGLPRSIATVCEDLFERGAANAQLLYNWGWALAIAGEFDRARRLMFEAERVVSMDLPTPPGFADIDAFNSALASDILDNPHKVSEFSDEEANRGSSRVDNLFSGQNPDLITALLTLFQNAVDGWKPDHQGEFDPWSRARPLAARLRPWGLIQQQGEFEEGHIHPGGWLSGVYYVRVPAAVSDAPEPGPGCIEFGPPSAVNQAFPHFVRPHRYRPREGMLILSPSHFLHRTIPSGVDEPRISIAFDVVPVDYQ